MRSSESQVLDLIFVSLEDWDHVWRRNQFVCAELARRHPEMRILFVGVHRNVWRHLRRRDWRTLIDDPTWSVPDLPNITVTRALRFGLERFAWGRWLNEVAARVHVKRVARRLRMGRLVLWLNPHWALHMVGRMGEAASVYDITDDWTSMEQPAMVVKRTRWQDEQLSRRADAVIVCSRRLFEMKRGIARQLHLIENGVNAEHYASVTEAGPVPEVTNAWARPVFGYTGTVHPERVDVDLVEAITRRMERGSLVFIGPNHLAPAQRKRLQASGRVQFLDAVAYADLPPYMRAMDAFIVPHRMTAFTESLNPIKLWEYLAAGKPIVSTNVAGFRDYPELIRIARDADEFIVAMSAAEAEGPLRAPERRSLARQHSWQRRVDEVEAVIAECTARAKGSAETISTSGVCVA